MDPMMPKDHMLYGEEGMLYREYTNRLAREGVTSSEIPGFSEWQRGEADKFRERNVGEEVKPGRKRYGIIKLAGIGLAAYLAFQAYSCFRGDRNLDKKEHSAPYNNPDENQNLGNLPPEFTSPFEEESEEEVKDHIYESLKRVLKQTGVGREIERGTSKQRLYKKWKDEREGKGGEEEE